jgi:hypothetical protein
MERYLDDAGFRDVTFVDGAATRGIMTARKGGWHLSGKGASHL